MKGNISDREKGLLVAAAAIVILAVYFVARVKPQTEFHKAFREEVANLERQVNGTRVPPVSSDDEALKKELEETDAKLKQMNGALAELFRNRTDETSIQALEGLMLEILRLAEARGVTVDTSGTYGGTLADFGIVSKEELARLQTSGASLRFRPLRTLTLRGAYPSIQEFVKELPKLRHEVSVLRFAFKTEDGKGGQPHTLHAEVVLAL